MCFRRWEPDWVSAVEIIPPVVSNGEIVSSTAVRRAVGEGRVADATRLLGRPFALTGEIRRGEGRGSTILFPTLNLAPEQELLPKTGVYATETLIDGRERVYRSATNVGFRPTFNGTHLSVESHLFGFVEWLTEGRLEVRFWERLRDEQKFSGPEELRGQIALDLERARDFFRRLDQSQDNATVSLTDPHRIHIAISISENFRCDRFLIREAHA